MNFCGGDRMENVHYATNDTTRESNQATGKAPPRAAAPDNTAPTRYNPSGHKCVF